MAGRAIWKGSISFGLVSIPVSMHSAVESKSLSFNQLHAKDQGRIRYKRTCAVCGEEVPFDEIVKGYEYEKDHYVTFTGDELDRGVSGVRSVDIVKFVPLGDIDPVYFEKPYYLAPTESVAAKPYKLLLKALADDKRVAVCRVAFRDKEHLAVMRVVDDVLVLETMHWPDEIREADFETLDVDVEPTEAEVKMAKMLIDNLTGDFEPDEFEDTYRAKLEELVSAKIEGREITVIESEDTAKVIDLMDALRASVEATSGDDPKGKSREEESATG
jgi:DNA end-binding protein Ku